MEASALLQEISPDSLCSIAPLFPSSSLSQPPRANLPSPPPNRARVHLPSPPLNHRRRRGDVHAQDLAGGGGYGGSMFGKARWAAPSSSSRPPTTPPTVSALWMAPRPCAWMGRRRTLGAHGWISPRPHWGHRLHAEPPPSRALTSRRGVDNSNLAAAIAAVASSRHNERVEVKAPLYRSGSNSYCGIFVIVRGPSLSGDKSQIGKVKRGSKRERSK
jgi:hypothetical protein